MSSPVLKHTSLKYRPAIDGLRALAILSVLVYHLNHKWLPGGFVGVDVFFVISGYLITSNIFTDCKTGSFTLAGFYQRRIARICPAFFTVAIATLIGAYLIYSPIDLAFAGTYLAAAALCVVNLAFMLDLHGYFQTIPDATPYLHYWSLSVEEQFYIFFPLIFVLLFKHARKTLVPWLCVFFISSLVGSVLLTLEKPGWAFYLLPTRAFELLAGCILAVVGGGYGRKSGVRLPTWVSVVGIGIIGLSFFVIHEGPRFPGFWPILPVLGAICVLAPPAKIGGIGENLLAASPLVYVGRISYSLYLWHWPVFSLVDYSLYLSPGPLRLGLKIGLSFLLAAASFSLIESPARRFLNLPGKRTLAYSLTFALLAFTVPLGIAIRSANYINAPFFIIAHGGRTYGPENHKYTVVLMGDSNGSMYGKTLKEISTGLGCRLVVISMSSGTPLPSGGNSTQDRLWTASLAVVKKEKPDCLILACRWEYVLIGNNKEHLVTAIEALTPFVKHLIILNQPPILQIHDIREAMREGARPPFFEDKKTQAVRLQANEYLMQFNRGNVAVVDVASHFQTPAGEILLFNSQGTLLYHDAYHLSAYGADFIREELKQAILEAINPPPSATNPIPVKAQ